MIMPGIASPLRPVIAAFYKTVHRLEPGWEPADCTRLLRQQLVSSGFHVESAPAPDLNLIVDGKIGISILPFTARLTEDTRRHIRQTLVADGAPEVVIIMAFVPQPRLARVDAPLHSGRQTKVQAKTGAGDTSGVVC